LLSELQRIVYLRSQLCSAATISPKRRCTSDVLFGRQNKDASRAKNL